MISVRRLTPQGFLEEVVPLLAREEAVNNLVIGLALRIAGAPDSAPDAVFAAVEADGAVVGGALRTPPNYPVVTRLPAGAAAVLARFFAELGDVPDGAVGLGEHGYDLAVEFAVLRGGAVELASDELVYELTELTVPPSPPGRARHATPADAEVVSDLLAAFFDEVDLPYPPRAPALAERLLQSDAVLLWEDSEVRSLACRARYTLTGAAIAPVYTPPASRGRGYASAVTAALCGELLASGRRFVSLHAERHNATANRIYRALGFHQVATLGVWSLR